MPVSTQEEDYQQVANSLQPLGTLAPSDFPARPPLYHDRYEHDACGIGFVAQKDGRRSNEVLRLAVTALVNHAHRGAVASDGKSGDGAGVLTQIPHELLARHLAQMGFTAPAPGDLALGMIFLPRNNVAQRERARKILEETIAEYGLAKITWRDVPVNGDALGSWAQSLRPYIEQIVVARPATIAAGDEFERKLYLVRKRATQHIWAESITNFYMPSLSSKTVVYKGLFMAPQLPVFYTDLNDPDYRTAIAVFHQRYSTNTFPTWERAQPFRMLCHNGEINTLQGNLTWMRAREGDLGHSEIWGADAAVLAPVISPHGSDSAKMDNALDLLVQSGRDIRHAMMMLAPKAWEKPADVTPDQRAFYRYHSCLQEPWDGPAALSFTDGVVAGCMLDRNGLRPARFTVLDDGLVIMSSEAGAIDVDERRVVRKGRLRPGEMIAVDTRTGAVETDATIVTRFVERQPYGQWLDENMVTLEDVRRRVWQTANSKLQTADGNLPFAVCSPQMAAFGYTREELLVVLRPMWREGREPIGSMGDDTPAAALSDVPRPLFHYFKQRFAEVTNPPIDSLREEMVMSLSQRLGCRGSLLAESPSAARLLEIESPILTEADLAAIQQVHAIASAPLSPSRADREARIQARRENERFDAIRPATIDCTWPITEGESGLRRAVRRVCAQTVAAVLAGHTLLILSDRAVDAARAPIPSLLAVSSVHNHLIEAGERMHASLIVESGEPREVHHFAALLGYGANAIHPRLALASVADGLAEGGRHTEGISLEEAQHNFIKAVEKGVLKIMSKMGIATLDSYCGAQVFDAVGISDELIQGAFAGTENFKLGGITYENLARDVLAWHRNGYPKVDDPEAEPKLDSYGFYKARRGGEQHAFSPEVVRALHEVVGLGKRVAESGGRGAKGTVAAPSTLHAPLSAAYRAYADLVEKRPPVELRDLLDFALRDRQPVPLAEVEPAEAILRRFSSAAMSHGALSAEAHEALTIAMNRLGGASNSGEGGEGVERYGTEANSKIKQVASGRFGVTPAYLMSAAELQIKMAQGSKPGEGGQLPGHKVTAEIARIRHTTPGVALDLAAAAPRHLQHRGPGAAYFRLEAGQPGRGDFGQTGGGGGRRHDRRGRRQGSRRPDPSQRLQRRHRRLTAQLDQERGRRVGGRPG